MDDATNFKAELESLREKLAGSSDDQLDVLLSEARTLLKKAFQTEFEEDARKLFREIRNRMDDKSLEVQSVHSASNATISVGGWESKQSDIEQRLSDGRRLFYAGEYYSAIDLFAEVLRIEPNNREARERLANSEDYIRRGIVPDTRVPFEARVAFGRAQSLERAQRFEEAREFYTLAIDEARKGGEILQNWQPAVEAILRVEVSIIAEQTKEEANVLLEKDKWDEAIEKYQNVLKLNPEDSKAERNIILISEAKEQVSNIQIQLKNLGDDPVKTARVLSDLKRISIQLNRQLSDSRLIKTVLAEVEKRSQDHTNQLIDLIGNLITQARLAYSFSRRKLLVSRSLQLLESAKALSPDNSHVLELSQAVESEANIVINTTGENFSKDEYELYQSHLEEMLLETPLDRDVLFRLEWIRAKRRRLAKETTRTENFHKQESDLYMQAKFWFWGSIITAVVLLGISAYVILTTVNGNNPLSSLTSLVSIIPLLATKLVYDQSKAAYERAEKIRKELEAESEKEQEVERLDFDALRQRVFGEYSEKSVEK